MNGLPLALSVPHAGLETPPEVAGCSLLALEEIAADGDEGAGDIYFPLRGLVTGFATSHVARAFVDLNRAVTDRRKDGVIKTHTCWNIPIYCAPLEETVVELMLNRYHAPYHNELSAFSRRRDIIAALDCHTMAEFGPPVGPDPGAERPLICLGDNRGQSCYSDWVVSLRKQLERAFGEPIALNEPFSGGYITQFHGQEMPWIQLEFSRTARFSSAKKAAGLKQALYAWCVDIGVRQGGARALMT